MVPTIRDAEHRFRLLLLDYYRRHRVTSDETEFSRLNAAYFDGAAQVLDLTREEITQAVEWVLTIIEMEEKEKSPDTPVKAAEIPKYKKTCDPVEIVCNQDWSAIDGLNLDAHRRTEVIATLQFVSQNPGSGVQELQDSIGLSREQLDALFSDIISMHPMRFLLACRMEKAKRLALQGYVLSDIVRMCGYDTETGFRLAFKKYEGKPFVQWKDSVLRPQTLVTKDGPPIS